MVYLRVLMRGLGTTRFLYNMPSYAIYRNQNDNMNKEYQGIFGNIFVVRRSMGHSGRESTLTPGHPSPGVNSYQDFATLASSRPFSGQNTLSHMTRLDSRSLEQRGVEGYS